jgi:hypothetical protein
MREIGIDARARQHLETLRAELSRRGLDSELVTSGFRTRLRLKIPGTFSDDFDDNVVAAEAGGEWMFFWPWIEPIGPAGDPATAAESVLASVCMDAPGASHGAPS